MTSVPLLNRLENVSSGIKTPLQTNTFTWSDFDSALILMLLHGDALKRKASSDLVWMWRETCLGLEEPVDTTVHQHPTVEEVSRVEDKYTFNPKSLTPNFWYLLLSLNSCLLRALHPRHQLIYVTYKNAHNASHSYCKLTVFCFDLMDSPCGRSSISVVARLCVLNL